MSVDLHMHTTASDGTFKPRRLVKRAVKKGLRVIAITDHDTTSGLAEALEEASRWSLDIIPGIEINTEFRGKEAHILGYFIDVGHAPLVERLEQVRTSRQTRVARMLERLRGCGVELTADDVARYGKGDSIGRPHVAQALVAKKHASNIADAFERWLGRDRPGYVPRESVATAEAIAMIRAAGGVPVLAHPIYLQSDELIEELIGAGLRGLEVRYPTHTPVHRDRFARMAEAHGLGITGGSDFHGPQIKRIDVGDIDFSLTDLRVFCERVGQEPPRLARVR
jgi:predicted metal-dependent phosphoesterase TrpH